MFSSQPLQTRCLSVLGLIRQLLNTLERQPCRAARIIIGFSTDMPTVDVLATFKWNTYNKSLQMFFYKGCHGMLPRTLTEELIVCGNRSSRLKHGLIAPSFASKYVQNFGSQK